MFQTGFSRSQAYLGIGQMTEWLPSFWLSKIWIFSKLSWLIIWDILNSNFNFFLFRKKRSFLHVTQRWSDLIPSCNCFFVFVFVFCFLVFFANFVCTQEYYKVSFNFLMKSNLLQHCTDEVWNEYFVDAFSSDNVISFLWYHLEIFFKY